MAVSRKAALATSNEEALTTGFESVEDIVGFLHHKSGYNSIRENSSIDNKGFVLFMRQVKIADPSGSHTNVESKYSFIIIKCILRNG